MSRRSPRRKPIIAAIVLTLLVAFGLAPAATAAVSAPTPAPAAAPAVSTYPAAAALGTRPGSKTIYNPDTGSVLGTYDSCYQSLYGANARAAFMELIRTGNYAPGMAGYLGPEDSELVSLGIHLYKRLNGVRENRSAIWADTWISCLP
ncbi:hypothetical protein D1871_11205 [Nakamurella silvestris]|nr:hypothetical protein D1871_11205 [Nakamurella silvestris]